MAHLPVPGPVIGMGISEQIGGLPSLTAAMVLITGNGVVTALLVPLLAELFK